MVDSKQHEAITLQQQREYMNTQELKEKLGKRIFTVTFTKKNGEERVLNGMLGVKKHLRGGEKSYNDEDFNYLTVYDIKAEGYRTVNIDTITKLVANGETLINNQGVINA